MSNTPDMREPGLTEQDLQFIKRFADFMIEAGIWDRLAYSPSPKAHFIEAYRSDVSEPVFGIGRHRRGLYVLADYRTGLVSVGHSVAQTLKQHAMMKLDRVPLPTA